MLLSFRHVCSAALILACCYAESPDAKAIQAVSDQIARAFEARELSKFDAFFTEQFRCSLYGGTTMLNREQFLQALRQEAERALPPVTVSIKLARLRVQGDSATASWSEVTEYLLADVQGKKHRLRYSQDYDSELVKNDGKWKFASITYPAQGAQKTLDGDPVKSLDELKTRLAR
jgi:uncharacterized protein (TIGR02246 family)